MPRFLAAATAVLALALPVGAGDLPDGNWRLGQHVGPVNEFVIALVKVETKDGKSTPTVIDDAVKGQAKVSDLKTDGHMVTMRVEIGAAKYTFEGLLDGKDAKVVRGSLSDGTRTLRASLHAQDGDKVERPTPPKPPEPMAEAQKLNLAATQARVKAQRSQDANEKAELQAKSDEAQKEADQKVPGLYREVVARHPDSPYAVQAADSLLRMAGKVKPKADEVATWVKLVEADAARYGPKIATDTLLQAGETLVRQTGLAALALPVAERAEKGVKDTDPLAVQSRALKLLAAAQKATGKTDASVEARLAKVEKVLDEEYVKKVPPFAPEKYAGRKDQAANRVVVMELFTGAQCPPCVAADAAFDGLERAYADKDLILVQYHMHIPGPDPLTNPDTIARWDYYRAKFDRQIGGVPSSLFNGKPQAGGGGGMANAESKFTQYRAIIDKALEEKSDVKVTGTARRAEDKVAISVSLDGVPAEGDDTRLRLLLVEEKVKYVGGNGMRFHHRVVRAVPGGAAGTAVTEKSQKKAVDVDLAEVRKNLTKYLDEFAAERPFPNPDRPMDFAHLKVVALVQNDVTGEILNAAEFEVEGK